jgi:hypothetical protein
MFIGDELPTDKPRFAERFGYQFNVIRKESIEWLSRQKLATFAFSAGGDFSDIHALAILPANASFFALSLSLLQGLIPISKLPPSFSPRAILYVAPPFRRTHFDSKQVVVHSRQKDLHEVFSFNLYPGPSAKKGIYGVLLNIGEQEGWITAHCSAVEVITPYENRVVIMHEGASGSGKSELLEHVHRESDGSILLGTNVISGEQHHITLPTGCELRPISDDMASCAPSLQKSNGKLTIADAEMAWFVRVNHILTYGTDPDIESLTIHPKLPLVFLNIDAQPGGTALLWDHIEDSPGKRCPNPRVIIPRSIVPKVVNRPVSIDVRSFGVRTPPCTNQQPTYGIIGFLHVLPPALAWLWRLVAPRGHDNPSINDSEHMGSEGVGSYWPFATGRLVTQANLLLRQIIATPKVKYVLCPNQYVGAWKVGFSPQWIMREYVARRGGVWFHAEHVKAARCSLLGYAIRRMVVEGHELDDGFFSVNKQPEVGDEAYDAGARILEDFFHRELRRYYCDELDSLGKTVIDCCLSRGTLADYLSILEGSPIVIDD